VEGTAERLVKFDTVTKALRNTYERKNKDYGNSFEESLDEFGLTAFAVRADDKMRRIKQLVNNEPHVKDEAIEDTIHDLANYSIMAAMWLEGRKCRQQQND
jgi:glutaredoxin 2